MRRVMMKSDFLGGVRAARRLDLGKELNSLFAYETPFL